MDRRDQSGLKWIEINKNRPMWTEIDQLDQIDLIGPKWTELD